MSVYYTSDTLERFWSKVDTVSGDCWAAYGVGRCAINDVIKRRSWTHV